MVHTTCYTVHTTGTIGTLHMDNTQWNYSEKDKQEGYSVLAYHSFGPLLLFELPEKSGKIAITYEQIIQLQTSIEFVMS